MYVKILSNEATHVWAVDISIEMLKQAKCKIKQKLEKITLERADTYRLPFFENQFHGVSCIGAMQLFSDVDVILAEIKRVIKDYCKLVVMTHVKEGVWKGEEHQNYLEKLDIYYFEVNEIKNLLKQMDYWKQFLL